MCQIILYNHLHFIHFSVVNNCSFKLTKFPLFSCSLTPSKMCLTLIGDIFILLTFSCCKYHYRISISNIEWSIYIPVSVSLLFCIFPYVELVRICSIPYVRENSFSWKCDENITSHFRENIFVSSLLSCIILVSESNLLDFTQTKLQTYLYSTADSFFVFILDEFSSQKLLQRKATWPQQLTHAQYSSTAAIVEATWRKGPADMRPL